MADDMTEAIVASAELEAAMVELRGASAPMISALERMIATLSESALVPSFNEPSRATFREWAGRLAYLLILTRQTAVVCADAEQAANETLRC